MPATALGDKEGARGGAWGRRSASSTRGRPTRRRLASARRGRRHERVVDEGETGAGGMRRRPDATALGEASEMEGTRRRRAATLGEMAVELGSLTAYESKLRD